MAKLRRARPIRRQFQRGKAHQLLSPVGDQPVERFPLQVLALPSGKIGKLQRQFLQRILRGGRKRPGHRHQFTEQHAQRPVVGNDVVHHDHKKVFLRR